MIVGGGAGGGDDGGDQRRRTRAREVFMREFARRAGPDGKVRDAEGFYVVVGKKT